MDQNFTRVLTLLAIATDDRHPLPSRIIYQKVPFDVLIHSIVHYASWGWRGVSVHVPKFV